LQIGRPCLKGRTADIPLVVPRVPHCPGEVLRARVTVTANGNQRFAVQVMLAVGVDAEEIPTVLKVIEDAIPVLEAVEDAIPVAPVATGGRRQRST